ncbi:MAG TPA: pyridoxamine 5'-phosphate oxidase family protein [bacterium]|nr:pyridoxamine 5'-phosphate oxidase family protein [bacterium]
MKMPAEVLEIFDNEMCHQLATCSKEGIPNICNVGAKYRIDDETIVVVDNYMLKTMKNVLDNPKVAILIRKGRDSYLIKGTCDYVTEGKEYEDAYKWMKEKGDRFPAKAALIIKVEDIFYSNTGPQAGKSIFED